MLNIVTFEQKDFQAGEIHNVPDNMIPDNGVLRLLNMIPGDSAEPLALRGGFQPWNYGYTYSTPNGWEYGTPVRHISKYTAHMVATTDLTKPFLNSGYLLFSNYSGNAVQMWAILSPSNVQLPAATYVTDDIVWSMYGVTADLPVPDTPPPVKPSYDNINMAYKDLPSKTAYPTAGVSQTLMEDYWAATDNTIAGNPAGTNVSYWPDTDGVNNFGGVQYEPGDFADPLLGIYSNYGNWMIGDRWSQATPVLITQDSILNDKLRVAHPLYLTHVTPSGSPTVTWKEPRVWEPYFEVLDFDMVGANRAMKFYFEYDLTKSEYNGAAAYIYIRPSGTTTWGAPVNTLAKPIVFTQQDLLPAGERYPQPTVNNGTTGTIEFEYVSAYAKVDWKIVFVPSKTYVTSKTDSAGGLFTRLVVV